MTFLISIIVLSVSAFISVAFASRNSKLLATIAAIAILASSVGAYDNYKEVLGQPIYMTWEEMPQKFTVIFFRIEETSSIVLWLQGDQLVILPYDPDAEGGLEGERDTMGEGTPSTFEKDGEGTGDGDGEGEGEGQDGDANGDGGGWGYQLKSRGGHALPGDLPPKPATVDW
jgi:hypothetical protein